MQKFESLVSDTDHRTYDESSFVGVEYVVQSDPAIRLRVQTETENSRLHSHEPSGGEPAGQRLKNSGNEAPRKSHAAPAKAEAKDVQNRVRIEGACRPSGFLLDCQRLRRIHPEHHTGGRIFRL